MIEQLDWINYNNTLSTFWNSYKYIPCHGSVTAVFSYKSFRFWVRINNDLRLIFLRSWFTLIAFEVIKFSVTYKFLFFLIRNNFVFVVDAINLFLLQTQKEYAVWLAKETLHEVFRPLTCAVSFLLFCLSLIYLIRNFIM